MVKFETGQLTGFEGFSIYVDGLPAFSTPLDEETLKTGKPTPFKEQFTTIRLAKGTHTVEFAAESIMSHRIKTNGIDESGPHATETESIADISISLIFIEGTLFGGGDRCV